MEAKKDDVANTAHQAASEANCFPRPKNPHLKNLPVDYLYHIGLDTSMDLKGMFGDVKFVCMGGSPDRMRDIAERCANELDLPIKIPFGCKLMPVGKQERYHMFKAGPVICVSHGMGMPSMLILLHEVAKLMFYAQATDYCFIRVGTSGGLGLKPGTVVVTNEAVNTELKPVNRVCYLGKVIERPTHCDSQLVAEIIKHSSVFENNNSNITVVVGKTMGTNDFYEEQGRTDGYLCEYTEDDHMAFLKLCKQSGVSNIEMESCAFADFCNRAEIPAAVVCAAIIDRLKGDQVKATPQEISQFTSNAITVVINFMRAKLKSLSESS